MPALLPQPDPDGLLEYSVVYTDRALNHMSRRFQGVMKDISRIVKTVYNAKAAIVVPGSGTFGMEAVARQFATDRKCLIIRNGWFSFRWTQILDMGRIASESVAMVARPVDEQPQAAFVPPPLEDVVASIHAERPEIVFAPHVETASGLILPDDYLRAVGAAVRAVDGLFVLDCVASGTVWVDMVANDVDVLISAPQKGWSGSPCCALVALGERARARIDETSSSSFACDLKKWLQIMEAYEKGAHAYHATMPTDALAVLRDVMLETESYGFELVCKEQQELGRRVRELLTSKGFKSVAGEGFQAPGVVVSYTDDADIQSGKKFVAIGVQAAAGVPMQCDEPADFRSFRIGLFGLDKLHNPERTVNSLAAALDALSR
ncbi:MAG: 2-aminoethylphosphonate--pyruvate transaminase [Candidatus Accumulibacter regalis]|uniref:2-aminoethylphosphonate--pyruvate transaminase n=1 Tax=Accumulibacter regalis TaxID=522306 RepID=A0A011QN92_ACCRE|nr:aminotransferase class V-fold PLP-dependent enzyme [Accumulibacter sp.]EXI90792.1 MAG: 2-aminoethylphosphonate--pyruvate transaminase [Candidatus Accumulibacter regalis]HRE69037.1 aminotransferase class V-fold PLP-dependent enzyme [Accumulibacter sp.]